jgi:WS/DGAT/MGAT family acyltransferase
MWMLDADPLLRSTFTSVTFLEGSPDFDRLRRRVARAVAATPALSHRVAPSGFDLRTPRWELDPSFDLDMHVRRIGAPWPGTRQQVLRLAAVMAQDPMDRGRPLWQFTIVEGLEDGQAALLAKMHHVLSDGVGAVRISAAFLDVAPDGDDEDQEAVEDAPATTPVESGLGAVLSSVGDRAGSVLATNLDVAQRAATGVFGALRAPIQVPRRAFETVTMARSLAGQLAVTDPARSPLWTGHHSLAHQFEVVSVDLGAVKLAGKSLGGTVNDVFVTAVAGAAGAYHRARGVEVGELRMSMPISTRHDHDAGGNAWAPTRVLVPAGETDAVARFSEVRNRLEAIKRGPSLGLAAGLASFLRAVPAPLVLRLARQQVGTVDFACSNVRGAPFDLWIAGARVLTNYAMGPTAGTAFNATMLSYRDQLDVGINADRAAIDDAAELAGHISDAFAELFDAAR